MRIGSSRALSIRTAWTVALIVLFCNMVQGLEKNENLGTQKARLSTGDKRTTKSLRKPRCHARNPDKCQRIRNPLIANISINSTALTSDSFQYNVDQYPTDLKKLTKYVFDQRKKCKSAKHKGFKCQRLKWYSWLIGRMDYPLNNLNPWVAFGPNSELSENVTLSESDMLPENWPEDYIFKFIKRWGDPVDFFLFHKYKQFFKSHELRLKVPNLLELKVSPKTHPVARLGESNPRFFWDPGFNLKLKLPFFRDELKVAISTGPSFLAGIGTGIVLLIIKGMLAPLLMGMRYFFYNFFWKEGSPWDMVKSAWQGHGQHGHEPWESVIPPPAIEHYEPPVHHHFDHHHHKDVSPHHGGWHGGDQKFQFSHLSPILQGLTSSEGRTRQHFQTLLSAAETLAKSESSSSDYVPSNALQAEVENYDPYYSPLLSRIDSIFTHLGYHEEGCRERAVCSIYKFPVKYAPYSNLLSAQLSKHQSELKRPVTKSPRILRFFKYMKAAKDGQGQANCIEMYPNCDHDTDSVTSLPMITTFNQLSELMGSGPSSPS